MNIPEKTWQGINEFTFLKMEGKMERVEKKLG